MPSKKFNAFEGKRYFDYDSRDMKRIHFGKDKLSKCRICKKKVDFDSSYYGYNMLLCKKCFPEFCEHAEKEVSRAFSKFI